jgi:hypothetical protein
MAFETDSTLTIFGVSAALSGQYRTSLDPPDTWMLLEDIPSLPTETYTVYDPTPATQPQRIY